MGTQKINQNKWIAFWDRAKVALFLPLLKSTQDVRGLGSQGCQMCEAPKGFGFDRIGFSHASLFFIGGIPGLALPACLHEITENLFTRQGSGIPGNNFVFFLLHTCILCLIVYDTTNFYVPICVCKLKHFWLQDRCL